MSTLFTLSKQERLKSRKEIEALFLHGKAFFIHPYKVFYSFKEKSNDEEPLQFMSVVPKRHFKKAVDRNRIRRQSKEAYRLQKIRLKQKVSDKNLVLKLALIYQVARKPSFQEISKGVESVMKRLELFIAE